MASSATCAARACSRVWSWCAISAPREPFPAEAGVAYAFARACIDAGAAVYPGQGGADGQLGDHALVTPPLTITSDQIQELVDAIDRGLTAVEALVAGQA